MLLTPIGFLGTEAVISNLSDAPLCVSACARVINAPANTSPEVRRLASSLDYLLPCIKNKFYQNRNKTRALCLCKSVN